MAPIHEASNSEIEINRKTPTCISTAACCKNSWSRGIIGAAASTRFTNGLSLSSSRRKSSISKAASDSSVVVCTAARRTLSFCFASGTWTKKYAALTNSPKLTMKINIVRTCRNISTLQLCIHSGFRTYVSLPLVSEKNVSMLNEMPAMSREAMQAANPVMKEWMARMTQRMQDRAHAMAQQNASQKSGTNSKPK